MSKFDKLSVLERTMIVSENGSLGRGVISLLDGILKYGSLNQAAKKLKMAYSKAWRIINETEDAFGFHLIDRDGARGSALTYEGEQMLRIYKDIQAKTQAYATDLFKQEISKLENSDTLSSYPSSKAQ